MIHTALNKDVLVEMPAHCVRTKKDKAVYVQYTIRAYRNEKGKPTSERVSIGKEDPETGMLIPNQKIAGAGVYSCIFSQIPAMVKHVFCAVRRKNPQRTGWNFVLRGENVC